MKLQFDKPSSSFGIGMGGGTLTPGRVGGAPGLKYRMTFKEGGKATKTQQPKAKKEKAKCNW